METVGHVAWCFVSPYKVCACAERRLSLLRGHMLFVDGIQQSHVSLIIMLPTVMSIIRYTHDNVSISQAIPLYSS